jgi:hypothetical protein
VNNLQKGKQMKLDNWLIDRVFQPFAHWFQRMTGRDNFDLSLCFGMIGTLSFFFVDAIKNRGFSSNLFDALVGLGIIFNCVTHKRKHEKHNSNRNLMIVGHQLARFLKSASG